MSDYNSAMIGIYSTSISPNTIDEAPMAYKDVSTIMSNLSSNFEVIKHIKSCYNFKDCSKNRKY